MEPWLTSKRTKPYDASVLKCNMGSMVLISSNWNCGAKKMLAKDFKCGYCKQDSTWEADITGYMAEPKKEYQAVVKFCGTCWSDIISYCVLKKYVLQLKNMLFLFHLHTFSVFSCMHPNLI